MTNSFESQLLGYKQELHPDPVALAELVELVQLLGPSSLGTPSALAARDVGIRALQTTAETRPLPAQTTPILVEAELIGR